MTLKTIATLLVLSVFAAVSTSSASAEGDVFKGRGLHGRGVHKRGVDVYGVVGGYGYWGDYGNGGSGYGDWYGISSGHDECPLFRKRVMTPDGVRIQMVPNC